MDRIRPAVEVRFGPYSGNLHTIVGPVVEAIFFDYWSMRPNGGDGAVTAAFMGFNAFPEVFAPPGGCRL